MRNRDVFVRKQPKIFCKEKILKPHLHSFLIGGRWSWPRYCCFKKTRLTLSLLTLLTGNLTTLGDGMFLVSHSWTELSSDAVAIKGWPLSLLPIQQCRTAAEWAVRVSHSGCLSYGFGAMQNTLKKYSIAYQTLTLGSTGKAIPPLWGRGLMEPLPRVFYL